ncbi:MAG: alpha/beta hydrolase [Pseudomonadales bacterium]|nr:alpha/beta hydrolase [Pseudomonadales bacterium]
MTSNSDTFACKLMNPQPTFKTWKINSDTEITGLEWKNDKPLAILAHANGFCAATWAPVAALLLPHYHVISYDSRGHGQSTKPAPPEGYDWHHLMNDLLEMTRQILEEKGEKKVALLAGNSLGGVIAAAAAGTSDLFERVVMLDPPLRPSDKMMKEMGLNWPGGASPGSMIANIARRRRSVWPDRETAGKAWREKPVFKNWSDESYALYLKYGMQDRADGEVELSCPPEVEASIFEYTGSVDVFELACNIKCPLQLVKATGGMFPIELYKGFIKQVPNGQLIEMEGGHLLPMERTEKTAEFLINVDATNG